MSDDSGEEQEGMMTLAMLASDLVIAYLQVMALMHLLQLLAKHMTCIHLQEADTHKWDTGQLRPTLRFHQKSR